LAVVDDKAEATIGFFDKETGRTMGAVGGSDDAFVYPFCDEEIECLGFNLGHVVRTLTARDGSWDEVDAEGATVPWLSMITTVEDVGEFVQHSSKSGMEAWRDVLG
jgi:hypothetical protein